MAGDQLMSGIAVIILAGILRRQGQLDAALVECDKGLALLRKWTLRPHPLAYMLHNQRGLVLNSQLRSEQALEAYAQSRAIASELLEPEHPWFASLHNNVGTIYSSQGRYSEALLEHREALSIRLQRFGPSHPRVAVTHNNLGETLRRAGHATEAIAEYREALSILAKAPGYELAKAKVHRNLGGVLSRLDQQAEAMVELQKAQSIYDETADVPPLQIINNLKVTVHMHTDTTSITPCI